MRAALQRSRDNNFRPLFVRGDAVRITYKQSPYLGETAVILRMSRAAMYGGQATLILDSDNKVVTIPVTTGTTKVGVKKYGFVKIPLLRIRVRARAILRCPTYFCIHQLRLVYRVDHRSFHPKRSAATARNAFSR
jgi:hypothetical protein